jgi:hypothetical protein
MSEHRSRLLRTALAVSAVGHVVVAGLVMLGFSRPRELPVDTPISVEIVAVERQPAREPPSPEAAEAAPVPKREAASPKPAPRTEPPPPSPEKPSEPAPARLSAPEPVVKPAEPTPPPPAPQPEPRPQAPEPAPPPAPPPEPKPEEPKAEEPRPAPVPPKPAERPKPPQTTVAAKPPEPAPPKTPEKTPPKPPEKAKEPEKPAPVVAKAEAKPKQEKSDDGFASLLKSVEQINKRIEAPEKRSGRGTAREEAPSRAQVDALLASAQRQMEDCWKLIGGLSGAERIGTFDVDVRFRPNGQAETVEIVDRARLSADPVFRVVAESAQRAAWSCRLSLPPEQYELWRNIVFEFDPKRALTG